LNQAARRCIPAVAAAQIGPHIDHTRIARVNDYSEQVSTPANGTG
jgi:hypothetical protein